MPPALRHKADVSALITHLGVADCAVLFTHLIQPMTRPRPNLARIAIPVCLIATPAAAAEFKPQADGADITLFPLSLSGATRSLPNSHGASKMQSSSSTQEAGVAP